MLKFDDNVADICEKASKQLAVLKRLGRLLTKQGKMVTYNSFIASKSSNLRIDCCFFRFIEVWMKKKQKKKNDEHIVWRS